MNLPIIGRKKEITRLKKYAQSRKPEFIALYERRRVGKTFLIRQVFHGQMTFHLTGLANISKKAQLAQFHAAFIKYIPNNQYVGMVKNDLTMDILFWNYWLLVYDYNFLTLISLIFMIYLCLSNDCQRIV